MSQLFFFLHQNTKLKPEKMYLDNDYLDIDGYNNSFGFNGLSIRHESSAIIPVDILTVQS